MNRVFRKTNLSGYYTSAQVDLLFSNYLNQAVKTTSNPTFNKLQFNNAALDIVNFLGLHYIGSDGNDMIITPDANYQGSELKIDGNLNVLGAFQVGANLNAVTLVATGDIGGAGPGTLAFTVTSNLTANSTGVGTIKMKGVTNRDSAGFIKIYIGQVAYYIPVFSSAA